MASAGWAIFVGVGWWGIWHFLFVAQSPLSGFFGLLLIAIGFIGSVVSGTFAVNIYDSTSLNRGSENIVVEPIVIFELAFRNVERQIFGADFVIAANNAALEDRPKAFNRVLRGD